jgi:hypothetical protein
LVVGKHYDFHTTDAVWPEHTSRRGEKTITLVIINSNYQRVEIARASHSSSIVLAKQLACGATIHTQLYIRLLARAHAEYEIFTCVPSIKVVSPVLGWEDVLRKLLEETNIRLKPKHFQEGIMYHVRKLYTMLLYIC